jgi:hypothetical protein
MPNILTKPLSASEAHDLRRTFETAIAQIQQGAERCQSKTPIAPRRQTTMPGDQSAEKRALKDAARALAQLWNISPTLVR